MDNIGVFDRSAPLPTGGHLEQSDGTAWMGMYCLTMMKIALELARQNHAYLESERTQRVYGQASAINTAPQAVICHKCDHSTLFISGNHD